MSYLDGKNVLITGGTGSFGKAFVRKVIERNKINKLIIYSRDELKQFEFSNEISNPKLRFFLGDVRDYDRLVMASKDVDVVIQDRKSTRLNSSHEWISRMPSSA